MPAHTKPPSVSARRGGASPAESVGLEVERALRNSSHSGLRHVRCKYVDGNVTLTGEVPSFYLKQVAQTIVRQFSQVRRVSNELAVTRSQAALRPPRRD
jgi:osmotically-inducible protein OsmY